LPELSESKVSKWQLVTLNLIAGACDLNMMVRNLELCARVSWEDSQREFAAGFNFEVFNAVMVCVLAMPLLGLYGKA